MVENVDRLGDYNWAATVWQLLVDALGETKEKMRTTKNVQINGFAMVLQVRKIYCFCKGMLSCKLCCHVTDLCL